MCYHVSRRAQMFLPITGVEQRLVLFDIQPLFYNAPPLQLDQKLKRILAIPCANLPVYMVAAGVNNCLQRPDDATLRCIQLANESTELQDNIIVSAVTELA